MTTPGRLVASGRDADIFEYGPGLVLRRSRTGRSLAGEARVMAYARDHGFPVPAVEELSHNGRDLVMERVDGPDMVSLMSRRPWCLRRSGSLLADLHRRLHQIPGPEWLPVASVVGGATLVHMDLHPLNVIMGPRGPAVIDWANAGRGEAAADVAVTWALLASGEVPTGRVLGALLGRMRAALLQGFLDGVDRPAARRRLPEAVAWKVRDAHLSPVEQASMRRLALAEGAATG
ncbi:MAG: phosphotransferase [Acidimicrobiales bacterium]